MSFRVQGWGRPSLTRSLGGNSPGLLRHPAGYRKGLLGLWTTPWDGRALWGSSFFVLALVVFLVAVPSRGPFAVVLASWLFSATRALVLSDRRRAQRAARGVIAAVEPGAGRPTPAHTSERDHPLAQNPTRLARSLHRQMSTTGSWVGLWVVGP